MPRMRTINEAALYLKELDSGCRITAWTIRTLIKTGQLPHVKVGNRILINLDTLETYLNSSTRIK
jgi:excisionase family DNA binding protein